MALRSKHGIRYFQFDLFPEDQIVHGVFMRHGGVSPAPWNSLNLGGTVGDERANVVENRRRIFELFGRPVDSIFDVWQVHSKDVLCSSVPRPLSEPHRKADAILTDQPGVTLFMRFADCVPVLLYDPVRKVVGLVHAGWQGTVNHIASEAVRSMQSQYGSNPKDLLAGIGPSIGPDHYEVGADVTSRVQSSFDGTADALLSRRAGKTYFDLWSANEQTLRTCGVESIEVARICTACSPGDWFSHRAEKGKTGRFGALIALQPTVK